MPARRTSIELQDLTSRLRTQEVLPWTAEQLVTLIAANAAGFGLAAVGWWQTLSRDDSSAQQLGWLNLAVLGLVVSGCANVLWLARGRRTVTLAKSAVLPHSWIRGGVPESGAPMTGVWTTVPGVPQPKPSSNGVSRNGSHKPASQLGSCVASKAMTRFHRPDCVLAVGKDVFAADPARHIEAGRRPCEICRP